uniref:Uncharacterized protein n=1 Tax=Babesia bovis TaxID=5865 RepID=S6BJ15_BABBO|nr:hypothetical protein [Babesia bovis]
MHRSTVDSGQHHPRLSIVRPDVTLMTPLDPGNSSILETMATLHGSRRPVLPEKGRAIDAVATPPKVLFDLMRVLPVPLSTSSFPKMYGSNEAVDYLLKSLEDTDFSHMPLKEYVPLPVNQLLHLRNAASGNDHLFEPNLDSFVEKDTKDPNIGLFSVLQYVDSHVGTDDSSHKARNESRSAR